MSQTRAAPMPLSSPKNQHFTAALWLIAAITLWRIACLWFSKTDLFVDESQYWLWGQEPAFGYFSKPPLIGWVIRVFVELGQSDAPFWVRLPAPLGYAAASVISIFIAQEFWSAKAASWAGVTFASLPGVTILALFVSTDDLLIPLFALAMLAALRLRKGPSWGWAVTLGAAIGAGLMAKYAMAYFVALLAVAMVIWPAHRIAPRDMAIAAGLAGLLVLPNLLWNIGNGFITFSHTADNAGWAGIAWNWRAAASFVATQIAALGPIIGVAFVIVLTRGHTWRERGFLVLFSLPVFAAVTVQALLRDANGNWAAPALLGAQALAAPWLFARARKWFAAGLAVNLALAIALPLATVFPDVLKVGGRPALERAQGVREVSQAVLTEARAQGVSHVIALDRRLLADLVLRAKGTGIDVRSWPAAKGRLAGSHYQLTRPALASHAPALMLSLAGVPAGCAADAQVIRAWQPISGALRRNTLTLIRLDRPCWSGD